MGRSAEWALTAAAAAFAVVLFQARGATPKVGAVVEAALSLAPGDRTGLACALRDPVEGYLCEFVTPGVRPAPPAGPKQVLLPVMTTDRRMFLVGGLFEEPRIREHVVRSISRKRFVARCSLRILAQVKTGETRFGPASPWGPLKEPLWAAEAVSCQIE